jgi:hypothetical protein
MILSEGKLPAYFAVALVGFILAFLFFPTPKAINNYYYIAMFAPAFFAFYVLRDRLELRRPDAILWGGVFLVCAFSGTLDFIKPIIYTAMFLLVVSRMIPRDLFRTSLVARGFFWLIVTHVFISMIFYGLSGNYIIGGSLAHLLGGVNCIAASIYLSTCLALAFPFWVEEKRWIEMGAGFILSIVSITYILQSRSGLVAMLAVVILAFGYAWKIRKLRPHMAVLLLLMVLLMYFMIGLTPEYIARADSGRFVIWKGLWTDWQQCSYLFGCGTDFHQGKTLLLFENTTTRGLSFYAHNIYFALAFYSGLLALFLFLGLCFYLLHSAWKNHDPWGGYLLAAMIGLNFDGGHIISSPRPVWIAILLPMAMIAQSKKVCSNTIKPSCSAQAEEPHP